MSDDSILLLYTEGLSVKRIIRQGYDIKGAQFIRSRLLRALPDTLFVYLYFYASRREILHLRNPTTFSEKMQWLKLHGNLERYAQYVDKHSVRQFVTSRIGSEHLIPLLGVWDSYSSIPFDTLPKKFVLKATHGSGYNYICTDAATVDHTALESMINTWMGNDYFKTEREPQYKSIIPRIIGEKYLQDDSGSLRDYKIYCTNGIPTIVQVDSDRFIDHRRDLMDINWKKLPVSFAYPNSQHMVRRPSNLADMVTIAAKLARGFPFVRVDLYSVRGKVYFGELTFTPDSGLGKFNPQSQDYEFGKLVNLAAYR